MTDSARPCDPGPLDDLVCRAKGVAAQAAYNAEQEPALKTAREAFAAARSAYNTARHEAEKALKPGWDQLNRIFANKCQLDNSEKQRLDRAWKRVKARLEQCRPAPCCDECECDWDDEIRGCDEPDEIAAKIAEIQWHIKRAKTCFDTLIDETKPLPATTDPAPAPATAAKAAKAAADTAAVEAAADTPAPPTGLAARVARVLAEIANIEEHAEKGTWPASRVYAAALVARWHLVTVWNGFDDVNEYIDCLCRALTCLIKGHAAVAKLKRKQAVNKCYRDTWEKDCAILDEQAVDEVLAEYLRICAKGDDDDSDGDGGYGDDDGSGDEDGGDDDGGDQYDDDDGHASHSHGGGKGKSPDYDRPPPQTPDQREDRPSRTEEPARGGDRPGRRAAAPPAYRDARGRYRRP